MTQKVYSQQFSKSDLDAADRLVITYAEALSIPYPLMAVIKFDGVAQTWVIGLEKNSDTSCTVNVSECPDGKHTISIIYKS